MSPTLKLQAFYLKTMRRLRLLEKMVMRESTTLRIKKKKTKEKASGGGSLDFYSLGSLPIGTHWY